MNPGNTSSKGRPEDQPSELEILSDGMDESVTGGFET